MGNKRQPKGSDSENDVPVKRSKKNLIHESIFSEGNHVFAKWSNRKFYAAILRERNIDGKWKCDFFDGDNKLLTEEFIIPCNEFSLIGQRVYASQEGSIYTPGIITDCILKNNNLKFIVAQDDKGDIKVSSQFIYLTESQARQIKNKIQANNSVQSQLIMKADEYPTESLHVTRSRTRKFLTDSPKPSSSGTQYIISDSDDDGIDNLHDSNVDYVSGIEPESTGIYENCSKLKGKTVAGKMRFLRTKSNDADANVLGAIPDEGSKFFKNLHILLTCTRPQSPQYINCLGSESENLSTDENFKFSTSPFVKDRLKLQLEAGGAIVYSNFSDLPLKFYKSTFVISNRPNQSAKYIQSIAAGIKVVCHDWVVRCCIDRKKHPVQELPLGWSLEQEKFLFYHDRKSQCPLMKHTIFIVETSDKNFHKFWLRVCLLAQANAEKLTKDSNLENVTCVLSESGYKDDIVDRVLSHSIPVVTTIWLIQTLIHGEIRSFDRIKNYRADYVDSDY